MAIDVKLIDGHLRIIESGGRVTNLTVGFYQSGKVRKAEATGGHLCAEFKSGSSVVTIAFSEFRAMAVLKTVEKLEEGVSVRYLFSPDTPEKEREIFIPGVWYRDNAKGTGAFPRAAIASSWCFDESRMSIPAFVSAFSSGNSLSVAKRASSTYETRAAGGWNDEGIYIIRPSVEAPCSYRGKASLVKTESFPGAGINDSASETLYLLNTRASSVLDGYEAFVRRFKELSDAGGTPETGWNEYAVSKLTRLLNMVRPEGCLVMGEGNGKDQAVYEFTAASFLVKSVEAACCFASTPSFVFNFDDADLKEARANAAKRLSLNNDDQLLVNIARRIGHFFLKYENDGRFLDCVNLCTGEYGGYLGIGEHPEYKHLINARCSGEAMKAYVELYQALKKKGIDEEEFLIVAQRVAVFFLEHQLSNGSFGRWWARSGKPENTDGTNGAHVAVFLMKLLSVLNDEDEMTERVRTGVRRAVAFYQGIAEEGLFFGDTLDADSADKEAGVVLLELLLSHYEQTKDEKALSAAGKCAAFVLSWVWQDNLSFPTGSPLEKYGFMTAGVSSVSIAHHHLDFYGMLIASLFLRYAKASGDEFYEKEARLMLSASRQLIAHGPEYLGRDKHFAGWQPEQINHTYWDYFNREENMNGTYSIDIAWVNVLGYSSYLWFYQNAMEALS
jgi:hypothetical protein